MSANTAAEIERLRALQQLLQRVVMEPDGAAWLAAQQAAGFADTGISPADARVLATTDPRRALVYRTLIRGTIADALDAQMSRTCAHAGTAVLEQALADFCSTEMPRSQILRDVAYEFARWVEPHWRDAAGVAPYLNDLARFELFEFDVYTAERAPQGWPLPSNAELAADQAVAFDGSMRLASFDWQVQTLPDDVEDLRVPETGPVRLLGYRDSEGAYRQMELTPVASTILGLLARAETLGGALQQACATHELPLDQPLIDGISQVLADLAERGVVLGGYRPGGTRCVPSPWAEWLQYGGPANDDARNTERQS